MVKTISLRPIVQAVPRLLSSLLKTVKIETLHAHLFYGLPDPADTGMLYGFLKPIEFAIARRQHTRFTIDADFDHARMDGQGRFTARMTPITVLPPLLRFGWSAYVRPKYRS